LIVRFSGQIKINPSTLSCLQEANPIFMNLKVDLQEAEEGGYIVSCPALPGCHSQGDNVEEALKNIKEAIVGCLESLAEERTRLMGSSGRIVEVTV
jgi:predicted RNase H-like HicB family nuclease